MWKIKGTALKMIQILPTKDSRFYLRSVYEIFTQFHYGPQYQPEEGKNIWSCWVSATCLLSICSSRTSGSCCISQLPRKMSEFKDWFADWLQDCTSPGKTLFTWGPWVIALVKGWFCVRIQSPWPFLGSKVGFCGLWLTWSSGQAAGPRWAVLVQGTDSHPPVWQQALPSDSDSVNDIIAQHDRIPLKTFYIYWLTQWNAGWGCALLTGERTPRRGRGCCPWLLGELLCCAPSSAATHMGDTRFWGHAVPSCFLSPTESAGFTTLSYLCSLG